MTDSRDRQDGQFELWSGSGGGLAMDGRDGKDGCFSLHWRCWGANVVFDVCRAVCPGPEKTAQDTKISAKVKNVRPFCPFALVVVGALIL